MRAVLARSPGREDHLAARDLRVASRGAPDLRWNSRSASTTKRAAPAAGGPGAASTADRAVDKIRDRFGWEAIGYGSTALGISVPCPTIFASSPKRTCSRRERGNWRATATGGARRCRATSNSTVRSHNSQRDGDRGRPKLAVRLGAGYITGYTLRRPAVSNASQKRAIRNYRKRLQKRGMARFEVLGLDGDYDVHPVARPAFGGGRARCLPAPGRSQPGKFRRAAAEGRHSPGASPLASGRCRYRPCSRV